MYIREITKIFNVNLDDNPVKIYEDNSRAISIVSRPAYFKSDGPMMETHGGLGDNVYRRSA